MEKPLFDSTDTFEIHAAVFHRMTGCWPPGKDYPSAMGGRDIEADRKAWDEWRFTHGPTVYRVLEVITKMHADGLLFGDIHDPPGMDCVGNDTPFC